VFKKFFGKKDGFYLQLEDEDATSKPAAKAKDKAPAKPAVSVPAIKTVEPVAVVATPKAGSAPAAKADRKGAKEKTETPQKVVVAPAITNFATDYLIKPSANSGRRLPGANMRGFMEMARQVEKPKAFKTTAAERKPAEKPAEKTVEKTVEK
jgi:hypothetical protein